MKCVSEFITECRKVYTKNVNIAHNIRICVGQRFNLHSTPVILHVCLSLPVFPAEWGVGAVVCTGGVCSSSCPAVCWVFTLRCILSTSRRSLRAQIMYQATVTVVWTRTWSRTKSEWFISSYLKKGYLHINIMNFESVALIIHFVCLCDQNLFNIFGLQSHLGAPRGSHRQARERHDTPGAPAALFQDARLWWKQPLGRAGVSHSNHTCTQRGRGVCTVAFVH